MDGRNGNSDDTLYSNHYATNHGHLLPLENTFLTLEVATGDTNFRTFGEIQFFGLEIEKMVIVSTGDGYETLHIMVGNDYFLTATGISNILQISNLRLKSLHFGRTCVDKNQITG